MRLGSAKEHLGFEDLVWPRGAGAAAEADTPSGKTITA